MKLFKKATPPPVAPPRQSMSVFHTDILQTGLDPKQAAQEAMKKTFQQPLPRIKGTTDATETGQIQKFTNFEYGVPDAQVMWYASQGFIGYRMCATIAQNWLVNKCCEMPAKDAVRVWFNTTVTDGTEVAGHVLKKIEDVDHRMDLKRKLEKFVKMGEVFGLYFMLFVVDGQDYEKPFNIDGIKKGKYKGMSLVSPMWCSAEMTASNIQDPASLDFYEPTFWLINGKRYHKSHFAIYRGAEVDDSLKPTYGYGGISKPQRIFERVYAAERTANEAPMLAMTKRLITLKMNLDEALTDEGGITEKLAVWSSLMNNYGIKVVGQDEDVTLQDTALNDLDATIMTQYQLVAAAANVPATKLLGTVPKGFNSSGEYEEAAYREELETIQSHHLTNLIIRHHELALASEVSPGNVFQTGVQWNPLDSPTATEQATINKTKAETDQAYVNAGAIDGQEVRGRIIADPTTGYNGLPLINPDLDLELDPEPDDPETDPADDDGETE